MGRRHSELDFGVRRTLERRVRAWRALNGRDRDVIFRQEAVPDTSVYPTSPTWEISVSSSPVNASIIGSIIFRLAFSGWEHAHVVLGGESFVALAEGLQSALWGLGRVPREHRTDSLSAALRNLDRNAQEDLTRRYEELRNRNPQAKSDHSRLRLADRPDGHPTVRSGRMQ